MDKNILLSNIDVHLEQKPKKGIYFDPKNSKELANKIESTFKIKKKAKKNLKKLIIDYHFNRKVFAKKYIDIVTSLKN